MRRFNHRVAGASATEAGPTGPGAVRWGGAGLERRRFLGLALKAGALALLPAAWPRRAEAGSAGATATVDRGANAAAETARAWRAMGTLIEVRVPDLPPLEAVEAIRAVRRRVEELEAVLTLYRAESPLVRFNESRADRWVGAPADLVAGVHGALAAARDSWGAYDPTVAPLMRAWGLVHLDGRVPSRRRRRAWRDRPGPEAVEVDLANRRMRRLHREVELDLGGIGKGIAVDAALAELARAGSRSALINFGGSIGVLGPPPGSPEGWPVAVVHPRRPRAIWSWHFLRSGHLATSGDYERVVETAAGRVHHLLDPQSGEPARGVASVTVWAPGGTEADVLSTSCFIAQTRGKAAGEVSALTLLDRDPWLTERITGGFGRRLG